MTVIFDHLTAVVAGVILLGSLFVIQQRDRLTRVEATLADATRVRTDAILDIVTRDTDNLLPAAQAAVLIGGAYPTRVVLTGAVTSEYTLATLVRDTPGGPAVPAVVRYESRATGDSAAVAGQRLALYRLVRRVDRGAGFDAGTPLGATVTDFRVAFGRATGGDVESGAAPVGVSHVRVQVALAAPGAGRVAHDQHSRRATLVARAETTVRPQNLGAVR